jgi:hypothetical protein
MRRKYSVQGRFRAYKDDMLTDKKRDGLEGEPAERAAARDFCGTSTFGVQQLTSFRDR